MFLQEKGAELDGIDNFSNRSIRYQFKKPNQVLADKILLLLIVKNSYFSVVIEMILNI